MRMREPKLLRSRVIPAVLLLAGVVSVVAGVVFLVGWPAALIVLGVICVAAAVQEVYF
ncbi:hypothetical protein LCGC14_2241740 [marine sediment metagenome]|uniref:Uncharacterized protein n=1 Tax=marine sediment metagenome TaxID=412755 RepID=A0A0F9FHU4_9ZZZZ